MIMPEQFSPIEKWEFFRALTVKGGLYTPPSTFCRLQDLYSIEDIKAKQGALPIATRLPREDAVYIHVPFCLGNRCSFCMYPSTVRFDKHSIEMYVNRIGQEYACWKDQIPRRIRSLYIGGGTPSVFSPKQMEMAFAPVATLEFAECAERTCELSPTSATMDQIETLGRLGFNRLSFGVQSLDTAVLRAVHRRSVPFERIVSLINKARECGFADVNVDMMIGLPKETDENVVDGIMKVARSGALSLTVYTCRDLHINSTEGDTSRRHRAESCLHRIIANLKDEGWCHEQGTLVTEYNCFGSPEKRSGLIPHVTYGDGCRNYHLHGFGAKAIGMTPAMAYKCDSFDFDFSPSAKRYMCFEYTPRQQMQLAVCTQLYAMDMSLDLVAFNRAFGVDFDDVFSGEMDALEALGRVERNGHCIHFTYSDATEAATILKFFWDWQHLLMLAGV